MSNQVSDWDERDTRRVQRRKYLRWAYVSFDVGATLAFSAAQMIIHDPYFILVGVAVLAALIVLGVMQTKDFHLWSRTYSVTNTESHMLSRSVFSTYID